MYGVDPLPYTYTHWNWVQEPNWRYTTITTVYNTIIVVYETTHHRAPLIPRDVGTEVCQRHSKSHLLGDVKGESYG